MRLRINTKEPGWLAVYALALVFVMVMSIIRHEWLFLVLVPSSVVGFFVFSEFPEEIANWSLLIGALAFVIVDMIVGDAQARMPFYEAAAQINPVLFVALAVSARLSLIGKPEPERRTALIVIYALILGEAQCLYVLATGRRASIPSQPWRAPSAPLPSWQSPT